MEIQISILFLTLKTKLNIREWLVNVHLLNMRNEITMMTPPNRERSNLRRSHKQLYLTSKWIDIFGGKLHHPSSKEKIFSRLSIDEFSNQDSLLTFHQESKEAVHVIHKVPYEKQPSQLRRHKRPQHKVAMPEQK